MTPSTSVRRAMVNPFVVMPVVVAVAVGGWALFLRDDGGTTTTATQGTPQLVAASTGTIALTVSAQGTIATAQTDNLSFTTSGTVTAVNVKAGQKVDAGNVLAEIDSASLQATVSQAEASLAQAKAKLSDDTAARASSAQLTADRSSVTTATDQLASARKALEGTKLVATFSGTVAQVNITAGQQLGSGGSGGTTATGSASGSGRSAASLGSSSAATGSTAASSAQIQVVSSSTFVLELGFDDTDVTKLAVDQPATIVLSTSNTTTNAGRFPGQGGIANVPTGGNPDTNAPNTGGQNAVRNVAAGSGKVTAVGQVAKATSGVAKYPVTVTFTDETGNYHAGATATATITYAQKAGVIQVPAFAVTTSNGSSTVTVSINGSTEVRPVTTGLSSGNMVEITSGLVAGEQVVVTGLGGNRGPGGIAPGGGQAPTGPFTTVAGR